MLSWTRLCIFPGCLWIYPTWYKYIFNCERPKGTTTLNVPVQFPHAQFTLPQPRTPFHHPKATSPCPSDAAAVPVSSFGQPYPALPGYGPQPSLALAHSCPQWGAWSPGLGLPLMPPGLPSSLAGMVGWALLGSRCRSWNSCPFLCPDNDLVFILLTCQRCVMRCKIKRKTCQEPMRCVLGAALPLPCISSFHCSDWCHLCSHLLLSPKTLLGCVLEGVHPCCFCFLLSGFSCPQAQ